MDAWLHGWMDGCTDACTDVMSLAPHDPVAAQMAPFYPGLQFYTRKQWLLFRNDRFSNDFAQQKSVTSQSLIRARDSGTSPFLRNF